MPQPTQPSSAQRFEFEIAPAHSSLSSSHSGQPIEKSPNDPSGVWGGHHRPRLQSNTLMAEVPVALSFNGIAWAVMMATPLQLDDFARGVALSEGIIDHPADCYDIEQHTLAPAQTGLPPSIEAVQLDLHIATRCMQRLQSRQRALSGRTGCGVCGVQSLQGLDIASAAQSQPVWVSRIAPAQLAHAICRAMAALPAHQHLQKAGGGIHAAAWARLDGTLEHVCEDIGRHNALDKLIGILARTNTPTRERGADTTRFAPLPSATPEHGLCPMPSMSAPRLLADLEGIVILSSRGSHELVRKCARVGLGVLATASIPTSMGAALAAHSGVQLWGQCKVKDHRAGVSLFSA